MPFEIEIEIELKTSYPIWRVDERDVVINVVNSIRK